MKNLLKLFAAFSVTAALLDNASCSDAHELGKLEASGISEKTTGLYDQLNANLQSFVDKKEDGRFSFKKGQKRHLTFTKPMLKVAEEQQMLFLVGLAIPIDMSLQEQRTELLTRLAKKLLPGESDYSVYEVVLNKYINKGQLLIIKRNLSDEAGKSGFFLFSACENFDEDFSLDALDSRMKARLWRKVNKLTEEIEEANNIVYKRITNEMSDLSEDVLKEAIVDTICSFNPRKVVKAAKPAQSNEIKNSRRNQQRIKHSNNS